MKKYLMTLGLMLGILSLASCQKDTVDNSMDIENGAVITRTFTMGGEWNSDTRSYYEEGAGVKLTGQEAITVLYGDAKYPANSTDKASKLKTTKGTPEDEDFVYSFKHSAISGATAYDYYFIMPNTTTNNSQSAGHRPLVYLNTIQAPKAGTFDPAQDYLVGRPLLNQAADSDVSSSATVYFKRLFAPLRMTIKDGGIFEEGEKILYATISQSTDCTQTTGLVGSAYLMFSDGDGSEVKSDAYEHAVIRNFGSSTVGNKVTAFYADGLEAETDGSFNVWYIVNPSNYKTGDPISISGDMTITAVTDKRYLSRTVTLPEPMSISANKLNKFSINFNSTTEVLGEEAVTVAFANVSSLADLTGWEFANCSINKSALEIANKTEGKITIPTKAGYIVKRIIALPSLYHPNNGTTNTLSLYSGSDLVGEYEFNTQKMLTENTNKYGYLVIDVPQTTQSDLALVRPSTTTVISSIRAITVVYEKSNTPSAAVELTSAEKTSLTFDITLANSNKYYYQLLTADQSAPTAESVVANGTEATDSELTISSLTEDTAYTLYVVPTNDDASELGNMVSTDAKTKSSAIDYYTEYTSGKDITVNGITFKAGDYTAVLGDATTADFNYHNTLNKKEEKIIIFMDTEGNYVGTNGSNTNIYGDIVIMSRYSNKKANIKPGTYFKLSAQTEGTASFTLLNLNIDFPAASSSSYLFSNSGAAADTEALIFKGCSINIEKQRFYQAHNSHLNYIIKNIIFENNVYRTTYDNSAKNYLFDFKQTQRMGAIETIKLVNNIFYNSNNLTAAWNITAYAEKDSDKNPIVQLVDDYNLEITCKNNTFIDLVGRDMYFKAYRMKSFNVNDNIFYGTQTSGTYDDKNSLLYKTYGTGHEVIPFSVTGNVYYGYVNWNHYTSDSTFVIDGKNTQVKLDASPFTTFDPANGVFVVSDTYAELGYQDDYTY